MGGVFAYGIIGDFDVLVVQPMNRILSIFFFILLILPFPASAAIAFDYSSFAGATQTAWITSTSGYSWNTTITGTNTFLVVNVVTYNASLITVSSVTCNSTSLTKITSNTANLEGNFQDDEIWYLTGVAAGTCTIQVNLSGTSSYSKGIAASYTGVDQTTPIDTHATNQSLTAVTSLTLSTTVNGSNEWIVGAAFSRGGVISAGTGTTLRASGTGQYISLGDSNGVVSTGSQSLVFTSTSGTWPGGGIIAVRPAVAVVKPPKVPDIIFWSWF